MKKIHIKIPQVKTRVTWGFNPVTRVIKDNKANMTFFIFYIFRF